jgi:hypothetical protein
MTQTCKICGSDFLTEADAYVVRPTSEGVDLYCYCQIKGFDEVSAVKHLKEKINKLEERLYQIEKQL